MMNINEMENQLETLKAKIDSLKQKLKLATYDADTLRNKLFEEREKSAIADKRTLLKSLIGKHVEVFDLIGKPLATPVKLESLKRTTADVIDRNGREWNVPIFNIRELNEQAPRANAGRDSSHVLADSIRVD